MKIYAKTVWLLVRLLIGAASAAAPFVTIAIPVMHLCNGMEENNYFFVVILLLFACTAIAGIIYYSIMSIIAHLIRGK